MISNRSTLKGLDITLTIKVEPFKTGVLENSDEILGLRGGSALTFNLELMH